MLTVLASPVAPCSCFPIRHFLPILKCRDKTPAALYFKYNTQLGPPYQVIIDTNFINFSIRNKIDLVKGMMDCLYAECTPCITDCVMAELEKLGQKYRVALKIAKARRYIYMHACHICFAGLDWAGHQFELWKE